uniref:CA216 n=1 Tax=Poecilia formosa TaxID=48698 RepID=A0A096LY65_POEFO
NKDSNFNFLPGANDEAQAETRKGGDENRNQVRPRNLPLGRDPQSSPTSSFNSSLMSPRSRLPCWSPLEPLPEIETGDDGYGRVPPVMFDEKKERQRKEEDPDDEWGDSDSESEFSCRSGGSVSSLNVESGGEAGLLGGWDRIGVGEPKSSKPEAGLTRTEDNLPEERNHSDNQSSDSDGELPELMDAVWTLRDRERFKVQEMEKHQVQLTMYRRLALIRWVRTLQGRVQEQQNRLQSSFDVILTHRKELLRMGAAATAVAQ